MVAERWTGAAGKAAVPWRWAAVDEAAGSVPGGMLAERWIGVAATPRLEAALDEVAESVPGGMVAECCIGATTGEVAAPWIPAAVGEVAAR